MLNRKLQNVRKYTLKDQSAHSCAYACFKFLLLSVMKSYKNGFVMVLFNDGVENNYLSRKAKQSQNFTYKWVLL